MQTRTLAVSILTALPFAIAVPARAQAPAATVPAGNAPASVRPSAADVGRAQLEALGTAAASLQSGSTASGNAYAGPLGWATSRADPNAHLSSSSRPSANINEGDRFDLDPTRTASPVMRGSENAPMATARLEQPLSAPGVYVVRQGDTLWEVCDRFFHDPWDWPRIWSYNPEIQNPHWIHPGDQIRLVAPGAQSGLGGRRMLASTSTVGKFVGHQALVPRGTVFLRDQGYLDDEVSDTWGEVGGSPDDQLLLSDGDHVYLDIVPGRDVKPGQELTVFRPVARRDGDRGTMVSILGTAKIDQWNPETRIARARLTESLNVIERGAKVGPMLRKFDIIAPVRNEAEVEAQIVASFYPHVIYGQNQVVFINRGKKDGIAPGNRLFAVVHGDAYRQSLGTASRFASARVEYQGEAPARIEEQGARGSGDDKNYPREVVGEIRVLTVRDHTAACIVTSSYRELERGQRLIARKGY